MPVTAIVLIIAGAVIAVVGAVLSTRSARRAAAGGNEGIRSDLAVATGVFGLVGMLFGIGYLAYLLFKQG